MQILPIPIDFKYDKDTQTLDVKWGDNSVIRYWIAYHPNLAFLSPSNSRRGRDFIQLLQSNPVKSEIIREGLEMPQPEIRPGFVEQPQTKLTCVPFGHKPSGIDGAA